MQRRGGAARADVEAGTAARPARAPARSRRRDAGLIIGTAAAVLLTLGRAPPQLPPPPPQPRKALVKVFAFHKDEAFLLSDWLYYHSKVFGFENVVVVDHESSNPKVLATLDAYAQRGVSIVPFAGNFGKKAEALSAAMRAAAATAEYLVPVDVDEFVVLEGPHGLVADPERILDAFRRLPRDEKRKFKFASRVAACPDPGSPSSARRPAAVRTFSPPKATVMAKTFFRGGYGFLSTDQGNHFGRTRHDNASTQDQQIDNRNFEKFFIRTPLTLLHFSMPDFRTWHEKLFSRAKAYGFTLKTQCAGVRRGQRYCRSFQKLQGGAAPPAAAETEYADVCGAIAAQRRETGGARQGVLAENPALADLLVAENPAPD